MRLTDRFSDYGLIAVAIAVPDPDDDAVLEVDSFLMSCRAIGRTVEERLWLSLVAQARAKGFSELRASFVPTAKNAVVRDLWPRWGLVSYREEAGVIRYRCVLDTCIPPWSAVELSP